MISLAHDPAAEPNNHPEPAARSFQQAGVWRRSSTHRAAASQKINHAASRVGRAAWGSRTRGRELRQATSRPTAVTPNIQPMPFQRARTPRTIASVPDAIQTARRTSGVRMRCETKAGTNGATMAAVKPSDPRTVAALMRWSSSSLPDTAAISIAATIPSAADQVAIRCADDSFCCALLSPKPGSPWVHPRSVVQLHRQPRLNCRQGNVGQLRSATLEPPRRFAATAAGPKRRFATAGAVNRPVVSHPAPRRCDCAAPIAPSSAHSRDTSSRLHPPLAAWPG